MNVAKITYIDTKNILSTLQWCVCSYNNGILLLLNESVHILIVDVWWFIEWWMVESRRRRQHTRTLHCVVEIEHVQRLSSSYKCATFMRMFHSFHQSISIYYSPLDSLAKWQGIFFYWRRFFPFRIYVHFLLNWIECVKLAPRKEKKKHKKKTNYFKE